MCYQQCNFLTIYSWNLSSAQALLGKCTMIAHNAPNCRRNRRFNPTFPSIGAAASPRLSRNNLLCASKMTGRMGFMTTLASIFLYGTKISYEPIGQRKLDEQERTVVEMHSRVSSMWNLSLDFILIMCSPFHLCKRGYYSGDCTDQGITCSSILEEESLETLWRE